MVTSPPAEVTASGESRTQPSSTLEPCGTPQDDVARTRRRTRRLQQLAHAPAVLVVRRFHLGDRRVQLLMSWLRRGGLESCISCETPTSQPPMSWLNDEALQNMVHLRRRSIPRADRRRRRRGRIAGAGIAKQPSMSVTPLVSHVEIWPLSPRRRALYGPFPVDHRVGEPPHKSTSAHDIRVPRSRRVAHAPTEVRVEGGETSPPCSGQCPAVRTRSPSAAGLRGAASVAVRAQARLTTSALMVLSSRKSEISPCQCTRVVRTPHDVVLDLERVGMGRFSKQALAAASGRSCT